jgi:cyclin H
MYTPDVLDKCRARANRLARKALVSQVGESAGIPPPECFANTFTKQINSFDSEDEGPWEDTKGNQFLDPTEESLLVSFYVSKLPSLIGPLAQVPRLRRESKVTATAAMLCRRFYLSNSVMCYDPKITMVAAAFLASKVEDAMTDVRYLEEGTNLMNAPVTQSEIIPAEIHLLSGIDFDLLCFHPYKAVLSITEDLRTYLKSEKGQSLVKFPDGIDRPIVGQDLKPMHDAAQEIVNDVIVSDIPLLYPPGQIGLAALMVANEQQQDKDNNDSPEIDLLGYMSQRFEEADQEAMTKVLHDLCGMIRELKDGKYGCANHNVDLQTLKGVHKKLKKCRAWGQSEKKKKRKKNKEQSSSGEGHAEPESKRAKTS